MPDSLIEVGNNLFKHLAIIKSLWLRSFGTNFEMSWLDRDRAIEDIIITARNTLSGQNINNDSHVSFFLRDPLSDRLMLIRSTNRDLNPNQNPEQTHFKEKEKNYDWETQRCFYQLHDRLSLDNQARKSLQCRQERGLTGWVAVSGIPIVVNSVRHANLESYKLCAPHICNRYGTPEWGNRISEFEYDQKSTPEWSTRYLGVPIKSLADHDTTIGVIRFTAPSSMRELNLFDLSFLQGIADIISALYKVSDFRVTYDRTNELKEERKVLEETGDLSRFLKFIARSLRSEIASLYINLNVNDKSILRLFDAIGISGVTGEKRHMIRDYTEDSKGLTYELLEAKDPVPYQSVSRSSHWSGINTRLFYENSFNKLGIKNTNSNDYSLREMIKSRYPIKLIGCGLCGDDGTPIGVLKVEFPSVFDDAHLYNNKSDQDFFKKCADILALEISRYKTFIETDDIEQYEPIYFMRYMTQIARYKLLDDKDNFSSFWEKVGRYAANNRADIKENFNDFAKYFPQSDQLTVKHNIEQLGNIPDWLNLFLQALQMFFR